MSDLNMPDRIFANFNPYDGRFLGFATANPLKVYKQIEYIRADLVDPAAIREAALREAAKALNEDGRHVAAETILALIDKKGTEA